MQLVKLNGMRAKTSLQVFLDVESTKEESNTYLSNICVLSNGNIQSGMAADHINP